jgi:hypothetical protein
MNILFYLTLWLVELNAIRHSFREHVSHWLVRSIIEGRPLSPFRVKIFTSESVAQSGQVRLTACDVDAYLGSVFGG